MESRSSSSHIQGMRGTAGAEYGLLVSLNLAKRVGQGPVAAGELAEQEKLPHDYVEQILLRLRRARLLHPGRRAKGGHHLAREPRPIPVKDGNRAAGALTLEGNRDLHPADPPPSKPDAPGSIRA